MTGDAHYLTGLEGCSLVVQKIMRTQFAQIIGTIQSMIESGSFAAKSSYVYLVSALNWSYTAEDHEWLAKLNIMRTLLVGNGNLLHPLRAQWGRTDLLHPVSQLPSECDLSKHLY